MTRKNGHTTLKKRRTNELSATKIAAYGLIMFSSAALNNIFVSYYIELFCFVLDMDSAWFFISQFVFMIWNASNDPIFGYLSDAMLTTEGNKRIDSIRWGGFLWCVAFVTVWFPPSQESWGPAIVGLYFMFCLCFYDGLLTFVEVNHQALLAEIGTNIKDRARCNLASAGFATIGSMTSYFGYYFWNRENLSSFRTLCLVVAALSAAAFQISATMMYREDNHGGVAAKHSRKNNKKSVVEKTSPFGLLKVVKDFSENVNARIYGAVNFLQCFDCTFQKNFFPFFLTYFARGRMSSKILSLIITSSFVLPWVATSLYTKVVETRGVFRTLRTVFNMRLVVLVSCLAFSNFTNVSASLMCFMLLLNRVLSESVCRLCPLVVSDLIDEDMHLNNRKHTVAATFVGAAGALGKFSQSLAPMLGYLLIPNTTLRPSSVSSHTIPTLEQDDSDSNGNVDAENSEDRNKMLGFMIVAVLIVIVTSQRVLWSQYTLHGRYLEKIKKQRDAAVSIELV